MNPALYADRKRRMETLLRLGAGEIAIRREATLLLLSACGDSKAGVIRTLLSRWTSDWFEIRAMALKCWWWKAQGKDPVVECMRAAERAFGRAL